MTSLDYYGIEELLTDEERQARDRARHFVQEEVLSEIVPCHRAGKFPEHLIPRMGTLRFYAISKRARLRWRQLHGVRLDHARIGTCRFGPALAGVRAGRARDTSDPFIRLARAAGALVARARVGQTRRLFC